MEKTSTSSCTYDEANSANDSDVKVQGQSLNAWAAMLVLYLSRTGEHHKLCPLLEWKQAEILHLENDSNDAMHHYERVLHLRWALQPPAMSHS